MQQEDKIALWIIGIVMVLLGVGLGVSIWAIVEIVNWITSK